VNEDQVKMKKNRKNEKKSFKKGLLISSKEVKKVMLACKAIFIAYPKKNLKIESTVDSSKCLNSLIKEFQDVFQEPPKGLPPLRGIEHQIDFIPGTFYKIDLHIKPIHLRPKKFKNKLRS